MSVAGGEGRAQAGLRSDGIDDPSQTEGSQTDPVQAEDPRAFLWMLSAIVLAGVLLRLHQIGEQGIWIDEANSILTARGTIPEIFERLRLDSSPPLFYLLLHYWMAWVGDGAAALRMLSLMASAALVFLTGWSGRYAGGGIAGLSSAIFIAASPIQVHYSQQVRMYTLLPLFALAATFCLLRFLRLGGRRNLAAWLLATLCALYTHNFAVHLLVVHGALILVSGRLVAGWKTWLAALGIGFAGYLPWLPTALEQLENRNHYEWFAEYWQRWGMWGAAERTLLSWSPGGEYLMFAGPPELSKVWQGLPTIVATAIAAWGAWRCFENSRAARGAASSTAHRIALWPLALTLLPLASAFLVSALFTPHYVPSRVDQMMLPGFAILVGVGIAGLPSRAAWRVPVPAMVACFAIAFVGAISSVWLHAGHGTRGYVLVDGVRRDFEVSGTERALAKAIAAEWKRGDVILFTSLTRAPTEYYLRRAGIDGPFLSFPAGTAEHLGSQNDARWLAEPAALRAEARRVLSNSKRALSDGGRILLVRGLAEIDTYVGARALAAAGLVEERALGYYEQVGVSAVARLVVCRVAQLPRPPTRGISVLPLRE